MESLDSEVKSVIESLIKCENIAPPSSVNVKDGSQNGDGYTSKTYSVTVTGKNKTIDIFIKHFPQNSPNPLVHVYRLFFCSEMYFYEEVYSAILKFQHERDLEDVFDNVAKYYHIENKGGIPPIVLQNLKVLGYSLRNGKEQISDAHIALTVKAYAKLHGISFAMKDQNPKHFAKLCSKVNDVSTKHFDTFGIGDAVTSSIQAFVETLDPIIHKDVYEKCVKLPECLIDFARNLHKKADDYTVICHGDCWSNNIMYSYDDVSGCPNDIKLLDWQVIRCNSPTVDLVCFIYGVARRETLTNFNRHINLYYDTLSDHITKLGSDPKNVYPREIFMDHLNKFSKYGLMMAFGVNRILLLSEGEIPNLLESVDGKLPNLPARFEQEDVYREIMVDLIRHFIERKLI